MKRDDISTRGKHRMRHEGNGLWQCQNCDYFGFDMSHVPDVEHHKPVCLEEFRGIHPLVFDAIHDQPEPLDHKDVFNYGPQNDIEFDNFIVFDRELSYEEIRSLAKPKRAKWAIPAMLGAVFVLGVIALYLGVRA